MTIALCVLFSAHPGPGMLTFTAFPDTGRTRTSAADTSIRNY
jgi:hypothetical protein